MKKINTMEKEFVPYELALKLKVLGFDKECFGFYNNADGNVWIKHLIPDDIKEIYTGDISAPLWQQAFSWFRTEHKLFSTILISGADDFQVYIHDLNTRNKKHFSKHKPRSCDWVIRFIYDNRNTIYEEARLACLNKLIELVEREYETD